MTRTLAGFVAFGVLAALTIVAMQGASRPGVALLLVLVVAVIGAALATARRPR